jgi:hypothetical protein
MGTKLESTPGPWAWDGPADNIHVTQAEKPDHRICFLTSNGPTVANAALIAAAPDLYRALSAAQAALKSYQYGNSSTELAREIGAFADRALAKAEGRS